MKLGTCEFRSSVCFKDKLGVDYTSVHNKYISKPEDVT